MNLGTVIRTARRAKDMTQDDLAGLLGVTLSAVSQWEQSRTMPDIALVPGICSALDISADMLFGLDPESKEDKIRAVIDEAMRMEERNEPPRKVLALLEDALAAYPDSMKLTEHHQNAVGGIMGGVTFTLADFAFAVLQNHMHKPSVAQQVSINFLAPPKGEHLYAEAHLRRNGRTSTIVNVDVTDEEGRDIAQFIGTGYKLPSKNG